MRKFTYWVCPAKREGNNNIRALTRKAANAQRHKSYNWEAQKVIIVYEDLLDLINKLTGTIGLNAWEQ